MFPSLFTRRYSVALSGVTNTMDRTGAFATLCADGSDMCVVAVSGDAPSELGGRSADSNVKPPEDMWRGVWGWARQGRSFSLASMMIHLGGQAMGVRGDLASVARVCHT